MTYKQLFDLIPSIFTANSAGITRAINHVHQLREVAMDQKDIDDCEGLLLEIQKRQAIIAKIADKIQKLIKELALLSHAAEGFTYEEYAPEPSTE